jgi:Flp pilus assembly protein CpaB
MNRFILFFSQRFLAIFFMFLAVLGSIIIYIYIKNISHAVHPDPGYSEVVLASRNIKAGQELTAEMLDKQPVSKKIFSDKFIYEIDTLIGRIAKEDVAEGELITVDKVSDLEKVSLPDLRFSSCIPPSLRAISIPVMYYGDRYLLKNGDKIDLISVFRDQENNLVSETLLSNKEMIMIIPENLDEEHDSVSFIDNAFGDIHLGVQKDIPLIITLYLEPQDIESIFLAMEKGILYISICPAGERKGPN